MILLRGSENSNSPDSTADGQTVARVRFTEAVGTTESEDVSGTSNPRTNSSTEVSDVSNEGAGIQSG
jgi:hypothetical protein